MNNYFCSLFFGGSKEEMEFINNLCLELKDYVSDYEFEVLFNNALINGNSTKINNIIYELMNEISTLASDKISSYLGKNYTFDDISLNIFVDGVNSKYNSLLDDCSFQKLMEDDSYLSYIVHNYLDYRKEY